MRSDTGNVGHGVTHEPTDATVTVWEGVDVIEPMMRGRNCQDARRFAQAIEPIAIGKIGDEVWDMSAGGRLVPADSHLVFGLRAPFAGLHDKRLVDAGDAEHILRGVTIEFAMKPAYEIGRCRFRQPMLGVHSIYVSVHPHMCRGLDLEISAPFVLIELARQRTFDILGAGVVPLDEIAVIAVHDTHESGKASGRARMECLAKLRRRRRQLGYNVRYGLWDVFQARGLNALYALDLRRIFSRSFT